MRQSKPCHAHRCQHGGRAHAPCYRRPEPRPRTRRYPNSVRHSNDGHYAHSIQHSNDGHYAHPIRHSNNGRHAHTAQHSNAGRHAHTVQHSNTGRHTHTVQHSNTGRHAHTVQHSNTGRHAHTVQHSNACPDSWREPYHYRNPVSLCNSYSLSDCTVGRYWGRRVRGRGSEHAVGAHPRTFRTRESRPPIGDVIRLRGGSGILILDEGNAILA